MGMNKVYVVLSWFYEGDSNLVDSFMGVYKTRKEALEKVIGAVYAYREDKVEFITFINYKTRETSNVFIEGYDPIEWGGYGSRDRYEIREVIL